MLLIFESPTLIDFCHVLLFACLQVLTGLAVELLDDVLEQNCELNPQVPKLGQGPV